MTRQPFALDRFQIEAAAAIDAAQNVLVAAPTGAGKTVVAEHAVRRALADGQRAFYTTPIKALSNQKYGDLVREHGAGRVGLLTGDNAVNPEAPIVVMTTEVLRNMVYAEAPGLRQLGWVVLDEVHYLQDPYRGPVWEEVLVHTPAPVRFVCLSATVSNAEELAAWISAARGPTATVVEHERPIELINHFLVFDKANGELQQVETLVDGRPNPEGTRFDAPARTEGPKGERHRARTRSRWATPRRSEVVDHLADAGLLPSIVFIFSRKGCDEAARAVVDRGVRLTTRTERLAIRELVERHVAHLSDADLGVLGYARWLDGMEAGVAAHHAGMVPPFKEAVEACFVQGLVKVVFATETLALGINMPARSVVIEALSKFTGEHHEDLTPSQYTQLTGRAGRRGLDPVGHAIVLWSPWQGFDRVAALASSREFVLRSSFQPTYNMVVNLVDRYDRDRAEELLGRSFAQFQADRAVGRLQHRRARRRELLEEAIVAATCERGDIDEYRSARAAERDARRRARDEEADEAAEALAALEPGDVVDVGPVRVAVLSATSRRGTTRVRIVDPDARVTTIEGADLGSSITKVGEVRVPSPYDPHSRAFQRQVASALRRFRGPPPTRGNRRRASARQRRPGGDAPVPAVELAVASCPDLDRHLQAAAERDRLRRQLDDIERRLDERTSSLSRRFDAIEAILVACGFLDGWQLTDRGRLLTRVFHESDLLVATVLADGLLDDLDPPSIAALVSLMTYEHRSKEPPAPPWFPSPEVRVRARRIEEAAASLAKAEQKAGLPLTRPPDPTFAGLAHAWASGAELAVVMGDEELSGGDFVRNIKQLIDLLRQVGLVAPVPATARSARQAADQLFRGIISASSEVGDRTDAADADAGAS